MYRQTKFKNSFSTARVFFILASLVAGSLVVAVDMAIAKPPKPRPPAAAPAVTPSYNSNFSGTVERYLLNSGGVVDGLLLSNGLQVKFPPHMADNLKAAVKVGDRVQVAGVPGVASEFGQEIRAYSITNSNTERTVIDQPPVRPPQPPVGKSYENLSATGTAQRWIVGAKGEIKGIVLSSGDIVRFPPHVGYQLSNLAQKGAKIQAQGFGSRSSNGKVLEARYLTVNGQTIPVQGPVSGKPLPPR